MLNRITTWSLLLLVVLGGCLLAGCRLFTID
jgi:outer membrane murein-binding lipoprotein Lpp